MIRTGQSATLYLVVLFFFIAGVMHFIHDDAFARIVPRQLPFPYLIVWITGVMEIIFAVLLLCPHLRRDTGIALSLYLLAVLPANIYMAVANIPFGDINVSPVALWIRVGLQVPLIALVLWATGFWRNDKTMG